MVGIIVESKRRNNNNGEGNGDMVEEEGETWSMLPDHLLWMIKERLRPNFVQNLYVAAVCRNWWSAFCSNITTTRFSLPWVMDDGGHDSDEQEFIDPWYKKKYTINLPDLSGAQVIYSKEGWLLLLKTIKVKSTVIQISRGRSIERSKAFSPFLLNPLTKAKVELPNLPYVSVLAGTFSIINGALGHVAFAAYEHNNTTSSEGAISPSLFIANLSNRGKSGDDETSWTWSKYIPTFVTKIITRVSGFLIFGGLLYCFDANAGMLVFDLVTLAWKEYRIFVNADVFNDILECEGQIIGMRIIERRVSCRFFRLNLIKSSGNEVDWVELKDDDVLLLDKIWFTGQRYSSAFTRTVKLDGGIKKIVYHNNLIFQQDNKTAKWISRSVEFDGLENWGVYVGKMSHYHPLWVDIS
ncbi:F-box protein At1g49360-like [Macadamia integrifolia]|uniref:F-box protein At1g49360-like n=1 Tax=Macadamia integrifolia TaxID=60698 RepID=UPI001C52EA71|nr:F-box protein At1g49360-like [Macadamia integrifolia]XP_042519621.1 F-box protein At1g49360-like [Macadamia integrifolia]XP_042519622.1 F-box protein At1g49360-like [Macadamia integrifolia]XP_042519623.1 F-box protein At1g49360-like [Macadamia integrifolia]XP_042519624.1 F-box protein At1g49360-like [Macadamia integrifolia]